MLGEGDNSLNIDLVDACLVDGYFGDQQLAVELLDLAIIRRAIDRTLVQERVDDAILTLLKLFESTLEYLARASSVGVVLFPYVHHDRSEEAKVLGLWRQSL